MKCVKDCKSLEYGPDGMSCSYFNKPLSHKINLTDMCITAYKCDECINTDMEIVKENNERIIKYLTTGINSLEKLFVNFQKEFYDSLDIMDNIIDDLKRNNESK